MLVAVFVAVWVWAILGLFVLVMVVVTLVVGDPISDMLNVIGVLTAANHARLAPRPKIF